MLFTVCMGVLTGLWEAFPEVLQRLLGFGAFQGFFPGLGL